MIHYYIFPLCAGKQQSYMPPPDDTNSSSSSDESEAETPIPHPGYDPKPEPTVWRVPKIRKLGAAEIASLREDFPNLKNKDDLYFQQRSYTQLMHMDTKLEKSGKSSRKLTEKMAQNLEYIKTHPVKVEEGEDNRSDKLHRARFLGGHLCPHAEAWLKARAALGLLGLDPVSRYDTEGLGLSGHINNALWAALSNPGSKELSIRMASPEALKAARGTEDRSSELPKKDFETLPDFVLALGSLRAGLQCIHPWNMSLTILELFLMSVNYGESELPDLPRRLQFLTEFTDDILQFNAEAWDDAKPLLLAPDLSTRWMSRLLIRKGPVAGPATGAAKRGGSTGQRGRGATSSRPTKPFTGKLPVPDDVCRRYNENRCPTAGATCTAPWDPNTQLRHVCAHRDPTTQAYNCLKPHPLPDHK